MSNWLRTFKQISLKIRTESWQCRSSDNIIGKTIPKPATERRECTIASILGLQRFQCSHSAVHVLAIALLNEPRTKPTKAVQSTVRLQHVRLISVTPTYRLHTNAHNYDINELPCQDRRYIEATRSLLQKHSMYRNRKLDAYSSLHCC